jgi:Zn-dependent peptidase ImmA (M78 family)/transcriptional regulator with XRE-family HTH domain
MPSSPNPQMLTLAREARGLTRVDLHKLTGVAQSTISKIETEVRAFSDSDVAVFAEALGYPPAFFYRSEAQYGQGTVCHHRKRRSTPITTLRQIHASMNIMRMASCDLMRGVEVNAAHSLPRMEVDDYGSVQQIAQLARQTWQLPLGPIKSMTAVIEAAGGVIVPSDFGTDKLDAISQWPAAQPPFFFVSTTAPGDRLRFNLAHELGHMIMHSAPAPNQEDEANEFAAEFLMPAHEIGPQLTGLTMAKLADLKRHWKVAMQALIYRAHDLGKITDRQQRSWFMRFNQLGYKKNEPVQTPREEPELLRRVVELHRSEHGYSDEDLSKAVRLSEGEFCTAFGAVKETPRLRLLN